MALQPENDDQEYARPANKDGTYCPLWKKPTSKVCHSCHFWQPLDIEVNGQIKTKWKCALIWQALLMARANLAIASVENEVRAQNDELRGVKAFTEVLAEQTVNRLEAEDAQKQIISGPAV